MAFLGARDLFLRFLGAVRRAMSLLGVGWRHVARFSANAPSGDSWCRASANQRLLTTPSAIQRQRVTQLVRARDSFVCQQNCASRLRPERDREPRPQRLRLIRKNVPHSNGKERQSPTTKSRNACSGDQASMDDPGGRGRGSDPEVHRKRF